MPTRPSRGPKELLVEVYSGDIKDPEVEYFGLTPTQIRVLESLLEGQPITTAATRAGVSRSTIYRWLDRDEVFRRAHERLRRELYRQVRSRLLRLVDHAATALEHGLIHEEGNARLALDFLKATGALNGRLFEPETTDLEAGPAAGEARRPATAPDPRSREPERARRNGRAQRGANGTKPAAPAEPSRPARP